MVTIFSFGQMTGEKREFMTSHLRWRNTVFVCALANAIQWTHEDYKNNHAIDLVIILFAKCLHYLWYFPS